MRVYYHDGDKTRRTLTTRPTGYYVDRGALHDAGPFRTQLGAQVYADTIEEAEKWMRNGKPLPAQEHVFHVSQADSNASGVPGDIGYLQRGWHFDFAPWLGGASEVYGYKSDAIAAREKWVRDWGPAAAAERDGAPHGRDRDGKAYLRAPHTAPKDAPAGWAMTIDPPLPSFMDAAAEGLLTSDKLGATGPILGYRTTSGSETFDGVLAVRISAACLLIAFGILIGWAL